MPIEQIDVKFARSVECRLKLHSSLGVESKAVGAGVVEIEVGTWMLLTVTRARINRGRRWQQTEYTP